MANKKYFNITLDIDGQNIKAVYDYDTLYSGLVGVLRLKVNLTDWKEEDTVVRFTHSDGEPIDIIVTGEYIDVPPNVILAPGFNIAVGGYKTEGENLLRFIPTDAVYIPVKKNGYGSPDAGAGEIEDPVSLEGQLVEAARNANAAAERVEDAISDSKTATEKANTAAERVEDVIEKSGVATENANVAAERANMASASADEKALLADEKAILADTAAENAETKALLAEEKAVLADTAAENANASADRVEDVISDSENAANDARAAARRVEAAIQNANIAAENANTAAGGVNGAGENANAAAENANAAAGRANAAAELGETKAVLADEKAALADAAANNANEKALLADEKAVLADTAAENANTAAGRVEDAIRNSEDATQNAIEATDRATNAGEEAEIQAAEAEKQAGIAEEKAALADTAIVRANEVVYKVANALKKKVSGCDVIRIDDTSPIEHTMHAKISSKNKLRIESAKALAGETITVEDGKVKISAGENIYGIKFGDLALDVGKTYTFSFLDMTDHVSNTWGWRLRYTDGTYNTVSNSKTKTITVEKPIQEIYIYAGMPYNGNQDIFITGIQVEEGDAVTPCAPFVEISSVTIESLGRNLISYPYYETTKTTNGITFTDNGDGSITANGTATADAFFVLTKDTDRIKLPSGKYTLSGCPMSAVNGEYVLYLYDATTSVRVGTDYGNGRTMDIEAAKEYRAYIQIAKGITVTDLVFTPQLETGSIVSEHEQYKNKVIYKPLADGTVEIVSISPTMTLITDTEGTILDVQYNQDVNGFKSDMENMIAELKQAIIQLGGTV